jgi:hypothetical protein
MGVRDSLVKWLGLKPLVKYKIIEVPKGRTHKGWDKNTREAVASLSAHPGFIALMEKKAFQADVLNSELKNKRHADIRSADFIQSGIFWLTWDSQQVSKALYNTEPIYKNVEQEDMEAIKEIQSAFEKVE